MNVDFFFTLARFNLINKQVATAEDLADRVNYQWSAAFLTLFVTLVGFRQYVFTPIQCWVPKEWPGAWEEYAENYCWIQETYFVAEAGMAKNFPQTPAQRKETHIGYYQWVPFLFALHACLFFIPHVLWRIASNSSGYDVNQLIRFAAEADVMDEEKKKKMIQYLATQVTKSMESRRIPDATGRMISLRNRMRGAIPALWFGKRSGRFLAALYICKKILYICNAIGQLYLLKKTLGFKSINWGSEIFRSISRGETWMNSGLFPRVTFCDVTVRAVGQPYTRTIQCVLPVNMLNEKLYLFLWVWIILCLVVSTFSLCTWVARLAIGSQRRKFVEKYLCGLRHRCDAVTSADIFVERFLEQDGVFILQMISKNVGQMMTADIIDEIWTMWSEHDKIRRE